jgi:ribonuclease P protein component
MVKTISLKKNYEFARTYRKGRFYVGKYIILYVSPNSMPMNRLGITVSKKVGKSVVRNREKRLIKECYRFYEEYTADGFDFVFVARAFEVYQPTFVEIKKEMKFLLKKLEVFDAEKWNCLKSC